MQQGNAQLKINPDSAHTFVVVFLRGGADGLTMVVPREDDAYYRARPAIAVRAEDTLRLNDLFGLNRALEPLHRPYLDGELLIIQGAGTEESSRSHFEAQDYMERGGPNAGGWLGRYLRRNPRATRNPLASVAFGPTCPESLRASPATLVLNSLGDIGFSDTVLPFVDSLSRAYGGSTLPWSRHGASTIDAIRRIVALRESTESPETLGYPRDTFGSHLRQIAQLIRAGVGVEAATVDLGGWDTHIATGALMPPLMTRLAEGLAAFHRDIGPLSSRVTVVVMSEFGRRVHENASLGTDHGRAGVMMLLGGGVRGGRVLADWPGLAPENLEGPGDLPVRFNYRDVMAPLFTRHLPDGGLNDIFPEYTLNPINVYEA